MKLDPEIYLEAAAILETGERGFCCTAISAAVREAGRLKPLGCSAEEKRFARYFRPREANDVTPWFGPTHLQQSQNDRVLALLFMHQIAKNP